MIDEHEAVELQTQEERDKIILDARLRAVIEKLGAEKAALRVASCERCGKPYLRSPAGRETHDGPCITVREAHFTPLTSVPTPRRSYDRDEED